MRCANVDRRLRPVRNVRRCFSALSPSCRLDQEVTVQCSNRARVLVLPGFCAYVADAPAVLGDDGAGVSVDRFAGAQIVDADVDGLGQVFAFGLEHQLNHGRHFEKGADDAAVQCGQNRVADQLLAEAQDRRQLGPLAVDLDAEKAAIGNRIDELLQIGLAALGDARA